jgi:membrane dipeptidase
VRARHPIGTVADVADHIDHAVELVGVDHVGLGSDFDGVFALPEGLQDASGYPNLVAELLDRGYSETEIRQILGQNVMRVWAEVEATARRLQNDTSS